jgi:hypothetical protein
VTGLLHGMTPLSWILLCLLLAGVLGVLGLIAAGVVPWARGFRAALDEAVFDEHCESAGVTDVRPERDR